ncbi:MAG: hypothetical protein RLZ98_898 [Pseudomonadota bacterium]|jgi:FMNH2-dependent dimethyl sulfone monooxygenase
MASMLAETVNACHRSAGEKLHMLFGLYAPVPHVTIGSPEILRSVANGANPLPDGETDLQFQISKNVLCAADKAGFDIILFAERHLGTDMECWILAGAISSWTERIRSMVAVHPGLWHPQLVAKMATSLDRLTKGRMAINLVTGWNVEEHTMYGGDVLLENNDRYVRAEEFIDVIRGLWSETPFTYDGKFYKLKDAQLLLKPATKTPPEIFTASRAERGLEMVSKIGDWWFLEFDKSAEDTKAFEESVKRSIGDMRERAAKRGRTVRFAMNPFVGFGPSREAAVAEAEKLLAPAEGDADIRKMQSRMAPAMKAGLLGRPDDVRDQLHKYHDLGIDLFLLKFPPYPDNVEQIREEIIEPINGPVALAKSA